PPMSEQLQQVVQQLVSHLADVVATTSGQVVRPLPAVGSGGVDWQVPLTVSGAVDTGLTIGLSGPAAQRLTSALLTTEGELSDAEIADTLLETLRQAAAACGSQSAARLDLVVGQPARAAATPPATAWQHDLVMDGDEPPRLVVWVVGRDGSPSRPAADAPSRPAADGPANRPATGASPGRPDASTAEGLQPAGPPTQGPRNLDVVLDLELPITVRFGATRLTLDALSRLGPGSLIDLERSPEDPVDLLVNGRLVARGDVV